MSSCRLSDEFENVDPQAAGEIRKERKKYVQSFESQGLGNFDIPPDDETVSTK